jgi:hypothetical protein
MSPSATKPIAAALLAGALLAACSDIYYDRRDTVSLSAGDALAADKVTHMVDPWPPQSRNQHIGFNGDRMQAAYERYRTGKVIKPVGMATTPSYQSAPASQ